MLYAPPIAELDKIQKPKGARPNWGYCGIAAMSAATGINHLEILEAIPEWPGYTPSRMVIKTLEQFGYKVERILIPKDKQASWPAYMPEYPSRVALGRIYYGDGKYSDSHWICFRWVNGGWIHRILLYDNLFRHDCWFNVVGKCFYRPPTKLKSLYFVV